jgi:hypothetical protein
LFGKRHSRYIRRLAAVLSLCALTIACAAPVRSVDLQGASPEVVALAQRANLGDQEAQLALGIRFEEGRGIASDLRQARKLYAMAARDSGGPIYVYTPAVGKTPGQVTRYDQGPRVSGLPEAKRRLAALKARLR